MSLGHQTSCDFERVLRPNPGWARRASAASVPTNGSAAHRQQPDPASEARPGAQPLARADPWRRTKEATMTTKLVALVLLCLMSGTAMAQEPKVTSLMS